MGAGVSAAGAAAAGGAVRGPGRAAAGGIVAGDNGFVAGGVAGIRGPNGGVWGGAAGVGYVNGQLVGGARWAAANGSFTHWGCFRPGWYARYPGAWYAAGVTSTWVAATWASTYAYCGCSSEPTYYGYGDTVYYQDDTVYYGDEPYASADDYYAQSVALAQSAAPPAPTADQAPAADDGEWMPLGIFNLLAEGETSSNLVIQLAINKEGQIRGNYYNTKLDLVTPVYGAADMQTQRVAVRVQGNDSVVLECGLYNLTNDEAPALLHKGAATAETWTLVRLQEPSDEAVQSRLPPQ